MFTKQELDQFQMLRRDFHAYPELKYEEFRTSGKISALLKRWNFNGVYEGIGQTGVVGVLKGGGTAVSTETKTIGIRADMDALPLNEENTFSHASQYFGKMHACGHDGHMAILLAAAKKLAESRNFCGHVNFIFQPAEEGGSGAKAMIDDGLFDRFPCDEIYALHNWPGLPEGYFGFNCGAIMGSSNQFEIVIEGKGGHAAMPHMCVDPVVVASHVIQALQTVVSRVIKPIDPAVLSVSQVLAGDSPNIIGRSCKLLGTVRTFNMKTVDTIEKKIDLICENLPLAFGATAKFKFTRQYPPTVNSEKITKIAMDVVKDRFGETRIVRDVEPTMGAEDFAFMLEKVPGTYFFLGNGDIAGHHRDEGHGGGPCTLHNSNYDFNDKLISIGAEYWVTLVENRLSKF